MATKIRKLSAVDESDIATIQSCRNDYERGARIVVTIANDIRNFVVCMIIGLIKRKEFMRRS
jgi:hypothetical protein